MPVLADIIKLSDLSQVVSVFY